MTENRIKELEKKIIQHRALYYQGRAEISDIEFDLLEDELRELDSKNQILKMVGSLTKKTDKVRHNSKMLSLEKTYNFDELKKWQNGREIVTTFKIDGVSCSLIYKNGELDMAKTRGDGLHGENITAKVLWIESILKTISDKSDLLEIRGELYCQENNFFNLAAEMETIGIDRPRSQRNIVAGLISRKENIELCRYISFQAFDCLNDDKEYKTEISKINELEKLGFIIPTPVLHTDTTKLENIIEEARVFMSEGDYQIDGLVATLNDAYLHGELGNTNHHPRFKIAFKFKGDSKTTVLQKINWSVSRNGILTPVGIVEPVELSGAKISRVTLHNYGMVKTYNLKSGDEIEIIRSGEVIPKFLSVKKESENEISIPHICPECGNEIKIIDIRLICDNENCSARIKEQILNFIKKIGIEDLSIKRLEQLIEKKLVKGAADIYHLSVEDMLILDKTKIKLAEKMYNNIQKTKNVNLVTFLSALGITNGAFNTCEKIVSAGYDTIEKLFDLSIEELCKLDSFAEKSSTDFINSLHEKKEIVNDLINAGVVIQKIVSGNKPLEGKKICITGALSVKRNIIEQNIRDMGGVITGSISKNTDILLTNDQTSNSSKFVKAQKMNVKTMDEKVFFDTFKI